MQIVLSLRSSEILARLLRQPELVHTQTFERDVLASITHDQLMTVNGVGMTKAERVLQEIELKLAAVCDGVATSEATQVLREAVCDQVRKLEPSVVEILRQIPIVQGFISDDLLKIASSIASLDGRNTPAFVDVVIVNADLLRRLNMFSEGTLKRISNEVNRCFNSLLHIGTIQVKSRAEVLFAAFLDLASKNEVSFNQFQEMCDVPREEILVFAESALENWSSFLSHDAVNYCKSLQFSCEYLAGIPLRVIGEMHGCTGENVRRRLVRLGLSPSKVRSDRRERVDSEIRRIRRISRSLRPEVFEFLQEYPGSTRQELCDHFAIDCHVLELALGGRSALVLDEKFQDGVNESDSESISRARDSAIQAIREASEIVSELTGPKYDELLRSGRIHGPSTARIHQVFESWMEACHMAGVEPGRRGRLHYSRQWTEEELFDVLSQYLHETEGAGTMEDYATWREEYGSTDLPSPGTILNRISRSWLVVRARTLLVLRSQWDVSLG